MRGLLWIAIGVWGVASAAQAEEPALGALKVTLTAEPAPKSCPVKILFKGTVSITGRFQRGKNQGAKIAYQFIHSGGPAEPTRYFTADHAGDYQVRGEWTPGNVNRPGADGWGRLKVWQDGNDHSTTMTREASFSAKCKR